MRPEQVPSGPLLVDTDVVSLLALEEERADEFAALVQGHERRMSQSGILVRPGRPTSSEAPV